MYEINGIVFNKHVDGISDFMLRKFEVEKSKQGPVYTFSVGNRIDPAFTPEVMFEEFTKVFKTKTTLHFKTFSEDDDVFLHISADDGNSVFAVNHYTRGKDDWHIAVTVFSVNPDIPLFFKALMKEKTVVREKKQAYALIQNPGGMDITDIGTVDIPLVRENYLEEVAGKYDHMMSCLASDNPCGRLNILDGPPGTGKSFMVKSVVSTLKCVPIMVPAMLVGQLSGPSLLPVLLDNKQDGLPFLLILEDADIALVKREKGNLSQLSDLLNFGDGILGDLLDIRIIATTNSKKTEMDPAVVRSGRLCTHARLDLLEPKMVQDVYKRITEGKELSEVEAKGYTTLSDVYRAARRDGWMKDEKKNEKPGQYI
jgi:hypothetical protein